MSPAHKEWCGVVSADRRSICGNPKDECVDHRCARPGCGHPKAMHETFDSSPTCIGELPAKAAEWTDCECPNFVSAPSVPCEAPEEPKREHYVRYSIGGLDFQAGPYEDRDKAEEHLADIGGYEGVHGAYVTLWPLAAPTPKTEAE